MWGEAPLSGNPLLSLSRHMPVLSEENVPNDSEWQEDRQEDDHEMAQIP